MPGQVRPDKGTVLHPPSVFVAWRYGTAIRSLQTSEQQNRFLALHDALTGLANRLQFDRALEDTITRGEQGRCAILCFDIDRFKAGNDTHGHHAGDTVIKTVADHIARAIGDAGITARIGGDEFIILLRNELDKDSVLLRCDTIIEQICQPVFVDGAVADVARLSVLPGGLTTHSLPRPSSAAPTKRFMPQSATGAAGSVSQELAPMAAWKIRRKTQPSKNSPETTADRAH